MVLWLLSLYLKDEPVAYLFYTHYINITPPVYMTFHVSIPFNPSNYRNLRFEREILKFSLPTFLKGIFSREFRPKEQVFYFFCKNSEYQTRLITIVKNAGCMAASFYQSHDSSLSFERK